MGDIVQLILGSILVIIAAYYTTYFIANRKTKQLHGRLVRVRERFSLSKDKELCVVEVKGKVYIVAFTNGGATVLDTFDASEFEAVAEEKAAPPARPEPVGIIQRGLYAGLDALKGGLTAKTAAARRAEAAEADFSDALRRSQDGLARADDEAVEAAGEQPEAQKRPEGTFETAAFETRFFDGEEGDGHA